MGDETMSEEANDTAARTAKPRAGKGAHAAPASFEDAMKRLEALVQRMEGGNEDLGAMVASFEEGQALLAYCNKALSEIERKVEILSKRADGAVVAKPFDENLA